MPGSTSRMNLPYPLGNETADVAGDIKKLAEAVDANAATRKEPEILAADIFASGFVLSGMIASKNATKANQLDVAAGACYVQQADGGLRRFTPAAASFTTSLASAVYYLDFQPDGTYSWGTAHSNQAGYLPIAEVTTDAAGNIFTVTDKRPLTPGVGKALPAAHKSTHATGGADALAPADIGAAAASDLAAHLADTVQNGVHGINEVQGETTFASTSGRTVSHSLGHTNYIVNVVPIQDTGGDLGDVFISKASNAFTIYNTGGFTGSFRYQLMT